MERKITGLLCLALSFVTACSLDSSGKGLPFGNAGGGSATTSTTTGDGGGAAQGGGGNGGAGGATACTPKETLPCYTGPQGTEGIGVCLGGAATCNDDGTSYGPCVGEVLPSTENCATPQDEDCDGTVNNNCSCTPGTMQNCYSGPAGTEGVGVCVAGSQTCNANGLGWSACSGDVTPAAENCASAFDEDCDGKINNGCPCIPNMSEPCYSGPQGTDGVGICLAGSHTCNPDGMSYGPCMGEILPDIEDCRTVGVDDDCNGVADDGCICVPNSTQACYDGDPATKNVGPCIGGTATCQADGKSWGPCVGEVLPTQELCNWTDDDCNGLLDDVVHTPAVILTPVPDATDPVITVAGSALGIGWTKTGAGINDLAFFGTADANNVRVVTDTQFPMSAGTYGRNPALAPNGNGFAGVFVDGSLGVAPGRVSFTTITTANTTATITKSANQVALGSGNINDTHIATNGNGLFFAVWDDTEGAAQREVLYGVWDAAGTLVKGGHLSNTPNAANHGHAIWDGGGFIGCWQEDLGGSATGMCQKVSVGGVLTGNPWQLTLGTVVRLVPFAASVPSATWLTFGAPSIQYAEFNANWMSPNTTTILPAAAGTQIDALSVAWDGTETAIAFVYTKAGVRTAAVIRRAANGTLAEQRDLWAWTGTPGSIEVVKQDNQLKIAFDQDEVNNGGRKIRVAGICP